MMLVKPTLIVAVLRFPQHHSVTGQTLGAGSPSSSVAVILKSKGNTSNFKMIRTLTLVKKSDIFCVHFLIPLKIVSAGLSNKKTITLCFN